MDFRLRPCRCRVTCPGNLEIIAALMIAAYPWYPRVAAAGSAMAAVLFQGHVERPVATAGFSVARGADPPRA
ncbi:integral membrane protein [Mycobacteroides abscessus subsp. abscessus]|nr:integral membrane protein [Mycobacteroides abscessus subsp. abscessus]